MPRRKQGSKKQRRGPEQFRPRMIFTRISVALHEAAKEVAACRRVSLSDLTEESLSLLVGLPNPNKPRTIVAQTTVVLHEAVKEEAARRNMSPDQFLEYALLTAVELHAPTQGTANDVNEKTAR